MRAAVLEGVPIATRWQLAGGAAALTVGATLVFRRLSKTITAGGGPSYDRFQRAGSAEAVREAREAWGAEGLSAARKAWALDLVYPELYGSLGALLASIAATHGAARGEERLAARMRRLSWLSLAAAVVDLAVENPAVAVGLWGTPSDTAAQVAAKAGRVKLSLIRTVGIGLLTAPVALHVRRA